MFKNEASFKIDKINLQKYSYNISNINANEIIITFKLTNLIARKFIAEDLTIVQGGIDIHDKNEIFGYKSSNNFLKKYSFKRLKLKEININVYNQNKKIDVISNLNMELNKNDKNLDFKSFEINSGNVIDYNENYNVIINELNLSKENKFKYLFNIETIERKNFTKLNEYVKNLGKFSMEKIKINYNSDSLKLNANGKILYNENINDFKFDGFINSQNKIYGAINADINNFPLLSILKDDLIEKKSFKIKDNTSALFDGILNIDIKDNVIEKSLLNIKLKKNIYFTNALNNEQFYVEDIILDAEYSNNNFDIKRLHINKNREHFKIKGKIYKNLNNYNISVKADTLDYNKIFKFLNYSPEFDKNIYNHINGISVENIKKINFDINKYSSNFNLNIKNCDLENVELKTNSGLKFYFPKVKIIKKNKTLKIYSTDILAENLRGNALINNLSITTEDYENLNSNIEIKSKLNTNYQFLYKALSILDKKSFYGKF